MQSKLTLYHYWRSSCSWRVRWALEHKGIKYKSVAVDLLKGEQRQKEFLSKNPAGFIPVLDVDGRLMGESLAILEWLEETHPKNPLLPSDAASRAKVRQISLAIVAGTQPLQNLKVQKYFSPDPAAQQTFARHWIDSGLAIVEKHLQTTAGTFCFGGQVTFADLCLIPQVYNGLRFGVNLDQYPLIKRIYNKCLEVPACKASSPDKQPDAKK